MEIYNKNQAVDCSICTQYDSFLDDKPFWRVNLSNGATVFQDDYRPGLLEHSAWTRLRNYIHTNPNIAITNMLLQFRSHVVLIANQQDLYYFSKGVLANPRFSQECFIAGCDSIHAGDVKICWYSIPELEIVDQEVRKVNSNNAQFIIVNNARK